jgi:hypothetical protein
MFHAFCKGCEVVMQIGIKQLSGSTNTGATLILKDPIVAKHVSYIVPRRKECCCSFSCQYLTFLSFFVKRICMMSTSYECAKRPSNITNILSIKNSSSLIREHLVRIRVFIYQLKCFPF